jgi:manganese transport protein
MAATSLPEVHSSIRTGYATWFKRLLAFAGPAYLVSVGYMDPGNWVTDLEGGARFGYQLIWILVLSNLMAILLQTLSARLGIVTGRDLAQACRETYPRPIVIPLWLFCEVAIAACDLAEVLGAAIALQLLFHLPLLAGVLLTSLDTLLMLWFTRLGIRLIEAIILAMIALIAACFIIEVALAHPSLPAIAGGLIPRLNSESLYVAIGILGATVMPHNLYLHSALVQTRRIGSEPAAKAAACRFNFYDSFLALNGALFVNAAILILSAAVFFPRHIIVTELPQAQALLSPLLGATFASGLFAFALLFSGQSSTLTGTLAGQIVMEGFLNFRMRPWLRRLLTRSIAIVPAAFVVYFAGQQGAFRLILLSQVILSLQLPFAIIPLVHFTSDRNRMGAFASAPGIRFASWTTAAVVIGLNAKLTWDTLGGWFASAAPARHWLEAASVLLLSSLGLLLAWISLEPWLPSALRRGEPSQVLPAHVTEHLEPHHYSRILVPLDHSPHDRFALSHAAALAKVYGASLHLLHVEEDVASQLYGPLASTAEIHAGADYLSGIASNLASSGLHVETAVRYSRHPQREIVDFARLVQPDLIVMSAHGHKGLKDIIFGTTINALRHSLNVPILIVRDEP